MSLYAETQKPAEKFPVQTSRAAQADQSLDAAWQDEEGALVQAAKKGDLTAFNRLVLAHQDRLYWWIVPFVRDETLAEDMTQMVFISAFRKLDTFQGGSFRAWLFAIARNRCLDEIRRSRRHPLLRLDEEPEYVDEESADDCGLLSRIPDDGLLPEETVIRSEQAQMIYRLVGMLPEPFRLAIELVDLHDMDYAEAAEVLHVPLGTVKSRVTRARLRLRKMFKQNGF